MYMYKEIYTLKGISSVVAGTSTCFAIEAAILSSRVGGPLCFINPCLEPEE